jgi:formamidopyrimidine-DNA glycosylase
VHLGMSGRLCLAEARTARPPHTHVVWPLAETGRELRFTDPRRFGQIHVVSQGYERDLAELAVLGMDPFSPEMTGERLWELAHASRRPMKTFLLDQSQIAGLGNIYVCEALFEAGIHPNARSNKVSRARMAVLRDAIIQVLERGLVNRGTTLRDYTDASGQSGQNQNTLLVYGREAAPCFRCKSGHVRRTETQGRGTFFCTACQKR